MLGHLQRVSCLFFGHQYWLGRGSDRLFLKCSACGHETAGVQMGAESFTPRRGRWRMFRGRAPADPLEVKSGR